MEWPLVWTGILFIAVAICNICVSVFVLKQPLLSSKNLFLTGAINFLGFAAIGTGLSGEYLYAYPSAEQIHRFVAGTFLFFTCFFAGYSFRRAGDAIGKRVWTRHARLTSPVLLTLTTISCIATLGWVYIPQVQVVGQILGNIGQYAGVFAVIFVLEFWRRRPFNPLGLFLLVGAITFAAFMANLSFGRRALLSVLMTLPLYWYWTSLRWRGLKYQAVALLLPALLGAFILSGISSARFQSAENRGSLGWGKVISMFQNASFESAVTLVGGDTVDASIAIIQIYEQKPTEPFFYFRFLVLNPIPRIYLDDKPSSVGLTMVQDLALRGYSDTFTIGPGIIGHGFHEGGLPYLAFYGLFFGFVFRLIDSILVCHSETNLFLLAGFCCAAGQFIAFSRGDIGIFTMEALVGPVIGLTLDLSTRIFTGVQNRTDVREVMPETN